MEKEGYVSLWVGSINSYEELSEYVSLIYTKEGEWKSSPFLKDYDIDMDDFDEDYIESVCIKNSVDSLEELICGCSYEEVVIPKFEKMLKSFNEKINTAILLYNFEYDGTNRVIKTEDYYFKYIGTVMYLNGM